MYVSGPDWAPVRADSHMSARFGNLHAPMAVAIGSSNLPAKIKIYNTVRFQMEPS